MILFLALFFVFGVPMLFLVFYFERIEKPLAQAKIHAQSRVTEKAIVKEMVMIPCRYCHGLLPHASLFCPNCGAKRTA